MTRPRRGRAYRLPGGRRGLAPTGALATWRAAAALAMLGLLPPGLRAREAAAVPERPPLSARRPLLVGATDDSFPYGYTGEDGRWTGFSVDLLDALARQMNLEIRRVAAPGKELQARFKAGEFDLMQALSQTEEREAYAEFSVPYLTLQGSVFVRKRGNPISRLEDLNGRRFAIIGVGSIGERFLSDHRLDVQRVYVSSSEEALVLLNKGECDATFGSYLTALAVRERAHLDNIAVFGRPLERYDIRHAYAVHKGDRELLARLNEGLAILQRSGEYDEIYRRWFGRFDSPMFTREQLVRYGLVVLAVALLAALWALQRQRVLRRRIARQAEDLARQQALLQALFDNVPLAMGVLENFPDGWRLLSINRQAEPLFRVPPREAAGRPLDAVPGDPEWMDLLRERLARPAEHSPVREERTLTGSRRRLVVALAPLAPGPEGHERICVLAEDVTASRALDEEVAQSRRLRAVGELVGGIAHEFNNLLTPVLLKVGEIRLDHADDEKLCADLHPIGEAARRAADLTGRLLALGRKAKAKVEDVDVASVVSGCVALLRSTFDRRITISNAVPSDLPLVRVNATDLSQVVMNLVINARDTLLEKLAAAPDGFVPEVSLEARFVAAAAPAARASAGGADPTGHVKLTVADNGMGMSREVRDRVFEPFFTTKDVGRGTGLGLATVWHVVTEAGGRVEVESEPGRGSRFHVFAPVGPRSVPATEVAAASAGAAKPARIFLGEDDDLVAQAVVDSMRRAGHTVDRRADGAESLAHLRAHAGDYALVLLDVNMPGLDGVEVVRRLRGEGGYRGAIVIISGRLTSEQRRALWAAPVSEILEKPFEAEQLLATLGRCLTTV